MDQQRRNFHNKRSAQFFFSIVQRHTRSRHAAGSDAKIAHVLIAVQLGCRNENAVLVCVDPISRLHLHVPQQQHLVYATFLRLATLLRVRADGENPDVDRLQLRRVPHAAMDDHSCPLVRVCDARQVVAEQSTACRSASIDHQHAIVAGLLQRLPHERIVLKAFDCLHCPIKHKSAEEISTSMRT